MILQKIVFLLNWMESLELRGVWSRQLTEVPTKCTTKFEEPLATSADRKPLILRQYAIIYIVMAQEDNFVVLVCKIATVKIYTMLWPIRNGCVPLAGKYVIAVSVCRREGRLQLES